jgi:hypothetical protein
VVDQLALPGVYVTPPLAELLRLNDGRGMAGCRSRNAVSKPTVTLRVRRCRTDNRPTVSAMSFGRHLRRRAQRVVKRPRSAWHRAARLIPGGPYRQTLQNPSGQWVVASHDSPYGEEDARFWDSVAILVVGSVAVGLIVALALS